MDFKLSLISFHKYNKIKIKLIMEMYKYCNPTYK